MESIIRPRLDRIYILLKITYALLFLIVGVDKFFNIMTQWNLYINPGLLHSMPISGTIFLAFFGALQIIIGIGILSPLSLWAMYSALLMLVGIFINLISMQCLSIVLVHDLFMIMLLVILMWLTTIKKK
jgi:hypothetical protein